MKVPPPSPCPRCQSKQIISKTWIETIQTYAGPTKVTFSKIICTNEVCQKAFDKQRREEKRKKAAIQKEREENEAKRNLAKGLGAGYRSGIAQAKKVTAMKTKTKAVVKKKPAKVAKKSVASKKKSLKAKKKTPVKKTKRK